MVRGPGAATCSGNPCLSRASVPWCVCAPRVCPRGLGHARVSRPAQKRAGGFSPGSREPGVGLLHVGFAEVGADRDVKGSGLRLRNPGVLFRRPRAGAAGVLHQDLLVCAWAAGREARGPSRVPLAPCSVSAARQILAVSLPPNPQPFSLEYSSGRFPFLAFAGCRHWSRSSHRTISAPIPLPSLSLSSPFQYVQSPVSVPSLCWGEGAQKRRPRPLPQGKLAPVPRKTARRRRTKP